MIPSHLLFFSLLWEGGIQQSQAFYNMCTVCTIGAQSVDYLGINHVDKAFFFEVCVNVLVVPAPPLSFLHGTELAMKVVRQARLELSGGSTPDQLRPLSFPTPCPSPWGAGGPSLAQPKIFRCKAFQWKVVSMCKSSRSSGAGPRKFTLSWSRSRSLHIGSPLNVSDAEFFRFMLQFLCLQMCVYGGSAVPQGWVGGRHLVTVPQGVVGDRLP